MIWTGSNGVAGLALDTNWCEGRCVVSAGDYSRRVNANLMMVSLTFVSGENTFICGKPVRRELGVGSPILAS